MPQFTASNLILIKAEASYGVDSTPIATDALLVSELTFPEMRGEVIDRNLVRPFMGSDPQFVVGEHVAFSFTCEVAGSGTAGTAPRYGPAITACRHAMTTLSTTSNTFTPISVLGTNTSATIYYWIGGIRHIITGWRGSMTSEFNNNGLAVNRFTGIGIYAAPTDTSVPPGTTYTMQASPLPVTLGNTLNINIAGFSGAFLQSFTFTQENNLTYNSLPNGVKEVLITSGRTTFSATIEAPTIAQRSYWADALTQTTGTLSITQGTAAGNRQAFSAPAAKTLVPSYSDDNGKLMLTVPGIILPVSGNDEYTWVFN